MKRVRSHGGDPGGWDTRDEEPETLGAEMFPFVRRAIVRAYSRTGKPVSREAVVTELLAMPETRVPLSAEAARHVGSGRVEWAALNLLLFFDHYLTTGRLPEYEDEIVRLAGHRGTWTYELFFGGLESPTEDGGNVRRRLSRSELARCRTD